MSELTYSRNGDYLIPDLEMTQLTQAIGKYGRMRKNYLKEHRPVLFNSLLLQEKLYPHLLEIDKTANRRMEQLTKQMAVQRGVNEVLKASDQMRWVQEMNNLKAQAEETVFAELIYN